MMDYSLVNIQRVQVRDELAYISRWLTYAW